MILKPQTVLIESQTVAGSTNVVSWIRLTEINGQITPLTQSAALDSFGYACNRPHVLLCDPIATVKPGDRVTSGTRTFKIVAPPSVYRFGTAADHAMILLEEYDA